jgi:hypothetical protein
MNVEIGSEAALFPEKGYINGIAVAVYGAQIWSLKRLIRPLFKPEIEFLDFKFSKDLSL